ncbi:ATP-binding protein [Kitasatospora sp. NPDC096128]|uniref:ATP-binding protein n=1 Tax=Kitasatospora sp. NPDC096128 TaxID=3155547 RepID=UPI00333498DD
MAAFLRGGRHRAGTARAVVTVGHEVRERVEAEFVETWLPRMLQAAELGLPAAEPTEVSPSVRHARELLHAFTRRVHRQAAADTVAATQSLLAELGRQAMAISAAQQRITDHESMASLYEADHANALALRLAVRMSALATGAWPTPRKQAAHLVDIGRAAQSRVADYQRIKIHGTPDLTVRPQAIEPLMAAVTELLDNALRHGGAHASVVLGLSADPQSAGAWVTVTDNGPGMPGRTLSLLRRVLDAGGRVPTGESWPGQGIRLVALAARHLGLRVALAREPEQTVATLQVPAGLLVPPQAPATLLRRP